MLKALDHRERGYRRVAVDRSAIEPYGPTPDLDSIDRIEIYVGRRERECAKASIMPDAWSRKASMSMETPGDVWVRANFSKSSRIGSFDPGSGLKVASASHC
jgi:hypothetical protein